MATSASCKCMSEFYESKTILLTGSAGFLGTVILEVLLRCFPGIRKVYILLRPKKNADLESRKAKIFKKKIFAPWLGNNPDIVNKVEVISGDICLPNMGLSEQDMERVINEVTIVFHCAASVSFAKPLRQTALFNSLGTKHALSICKQLKKLEVLVFTSTAYSFSNYHPYIEEKVYRLPFPAQRFLDELENGTDESFEKLWKLCAPRWPNFYTFSKGLAENILQDNAADMPIAIVRPSIIIPAYKTGYVEEGHGLIDFGILIGKGFIRTANGDPNSKLDLVPLDIVANAHVAAAWSLGTARCSSPLVINSTAGHVMPVTVQHYSDCVVEFVKKNPIPQSVFPPSSKIIKNKTLFKLYRLYEHYLPAFLIDLILRYKGSNVRLTAHYKFYDEMVDTLYFFLTQTFDFETNKLKELSHMIDPSEKELIYLDMEGVTLESILEKCKIGSTIYEWENDKKSIHDRQQTILKRSRYINFIKFAAIGLMIWMIYSIFAKLLFTI